jgi:beta-N-acetylhexosaminidase
MNGRPPPPENDNAPGPVLIGLEALEVTDEERGWLRHPAVGGVVLFTRNYASRAQLRELNQAIRELAAAPALICVDHEGGRVQRFRDGFTRLPPLAVLGRMYGDSRSKACDFAYRHGRVMATELLMEGIDLSFAPVLDLYLDSCVIGDRAFSADPGAVSELGAHYLAGMHDAGMKTCGKHFPGHGSVRADSHVDEVIDERGTEAIESTDLRPFRELLRDLDALMMAHVIYPKLDSCPAGYSKRWIQKCLRGRLGFRGVVLSDDLGMHAAAFAGKLADRLQRSLEAGCDVVLVCQPRDVRELLAGMAESPATAGPALDRLRGQVLVAADELAQVGEWRHWQQSLEELEHSKWA